MSRADAKTIQAERREEHKGPHHYEFHYGSMPLGHPACRGADTEHITVGFDKGILQVTVPLPKAEAESRRIKVSHPEIPAGRAGAPGRSGGGPQAC